ncbi:MAG TPA: hypothetical protein VF053_15875 [Streptosporangiales bacterium]
MADKSYVRRKVERAHIATRHPVARVGTLATAGFATALSIAKPGMQAVAWAAQKMSEGLGHVPWEVAGGGAAAAAAIYAGASAVGAMRETSMGPEKVAKRSAELQRAMEGGPRVGAVSAFRTVRASNRRANDAARLQRSGRGQDRRPERQEQAKDRGRGGRG